MICFLVAFSVTMNASLFSFSIWLNVFSVTYGASIIVAACSEVISLFGAGAAVACSFSAVDSIDFSLLIFRSPSIRCEWVPAESSDIQLQTENKLLALLALSPEPDQGCLCPWHA